jgi:NAD(P)H-dependent FMN reductase
MNIEIISGSPRDESVTYRLALFLLQFIREKTTHQVGLIDVRDQPLLRLQKVISTVEKAPAEFKTVSEKIFAADAFILVTPEYNGSYSAALKNLLDHYPKQMHKAFGIVTASTGGMGGMRATQQLQLLVNALFGIASPYMLVTPFVDKKFSAEGSLLDGSFQDKINTFAHEFLWLAERLAK